jgi:hypothetical protein
MQDKRSADNQRLKTTPASTIGRRIHNLTSGHRTRRSGHRPTVLLQQLVRSDIFELPEVYWLTDEHFGHLPGRIQYGLKAQSFVNLHSKPVKCCERDEWTIPSLKSRTRTWNELSCYTYVVLSSSFPCSEAGSHSSNALLSSLSVASSASLVASRPSASLIALHRDRRAASSWLMAAAWSSAEGKEDGLVEDLRADSRAFERAVKDAIGACQY